MVNLGCINGKYHVLTVHDKSKEIIERAPEFRDYCARNKCTIELHYVQFRNITSMYGSLHCATQVLDRTPFEQDGIIREKD